MGAQTSTQKIIKKNEISFTIHGKRHHVKLGDDVEGPGQNITPETSLLTYLRDVAQMKDTKAMCREGGCGVCIVNVTVKHPRTGRLNTMAVNSCLVPVLACNNWSITTVKGVGNRDTGYHPIQQALVKHQGTQCGFCSPGMVLNMLALVESREVLTTREMEASFGGNLCRCTGYRPIMDAFKALPDIEELRVCPRGPCPVQQASGSYRLQLHQDMHWYKADSLADVLRFLRHVGSASYRLVAGNTAQGVFPIINPPQYWVDIRSVKELVAYQLDARGHLVLGANISLSDAMDLMLRLAEEEANTFWYLQHLQQHLELVAHVPVRNVGTLAGNLMMKHDHPEFPSDVFLLLEAVGAELTVVREDGKETHMSPEDFLGHNMHKCVLRTVALPPLPREAHHFRSYKVMPRWQNAHAQVNAAFLVEVGPGGKGVVRRARLVYGGISPGFVHAVGAERALHGHPLHQEATLHAVLDALQLELRPDHILPDPDPEFRRRLATNLFYKFFLSTAPGNLVESRLQSGGQRLQHAVMSGAQLYQTFPDTFPVSQPVHKLEGLIQTSGEAQYVDDMPPFHEELFGALVLAEATPMSKIKRIDTTEALSLPGVVTFLSYKDIPGPNLFSTSLLNANDEKLFAEDLVEYNGQPVGVILADTYERAVHAATKVNITFEKTNRKPLLTIQDVLDSKEKDKRIKLEGSLEPKKKGSDVKKVLKGAFKLPGQYHFHMETQRCICVPTENGGLEIYPSSQWMDHVQMSASKATKLPMDKIHVVVNRLGGTYGAKILRASMVSTACAVSSFVTKRPVRLILPLDINMKVIGKRFPTQAEYEIGVNDEGVIQYLNTSIYQASGVSGSNETMVMVIPHYMTSAYNSDSWSVKAYNVKTDMAGNSYCRAPGACEAIGLIETIMDHISSELSLSPVEVRRVNMSSTTEVPQVLTTALDWTKYDDKLKEVEDFNANHQWMKKGVSLVLMDYKLLLFYPYSVFLTVYAGDGTVNISHGGIECGQGINTKIVQVCAYELGIPMEMISTRPSNSFTSPNNMMTGGSVTSEQLCLATIKACQQLKQRLEPIKTKIPTSSWQDLIWQAHQEGIELSATYLYKKGDMQEYSIPAICVCSVQVDLLTGEHVVQSLDLLEDVGHSLSPGVDAGQLEGAIAMGLGMYTSEDLVYSPQGKLLTSNTWTYKPPTVRDLPQDMRIMFLHGSGNPKGVLHSKATGEPALCLSIAIPSAIRNALSSAQDSQNSNKFINIDGPFTTEFKLINSSTHYKNFKL